MKMPVGHLVSIQVTVTVTGSADPHGGSAGEFGLDILGDLTAMESAVLDENLVSAHAGNDHSGEVDTRYIALQRLRIARRAAVFPFHLYANRSQKIKVGMVPGQGKDKIILQSNQSLRRQQLDRVFRDAGHGAGKVGSDFAVLDAIVDVRQNPVFDVVMHGL